MANVSSEAPPPSQLSPNSDMPDLNRANMSILDKVKNFTAATIMYWHGMIYTAKAMIRTAATSPAMPKAESDEIKYAVGIMYVEGLMLVINNSIDTSISIVGPRRMGQHELHHTQGLGQHELFPTQGLFFLTCGNVVLAIKNLSILWSNRTHFTPKKFYVHLLYAVLAVYCATIEFLDMTIGGVGDKFFPFKGFPFIISVAIFLLLILEIIWGIKKSIPISSIAAGAPLALESIKVVRSDRDASTSNPPPANIIPKAAAAGTVRQRGGSSSSDSNSTSSNDAATKTEGSTDTAAKTKANKPKAV